MSERNEIGAHWKSYCPDSYTADVGNGYLAVATIRRIGDDTAVEVRLYTRHKDLYAACNFKFFDWDKQADAWMRERGITDYV